MLAIRAISLAASGNTESVVADGFTWQYALYRLVYVERHETILVAKQRERNMKHWPRAWKVRLILRDNPRWEDLFDRTP